MSPLRQGVELEVHVINVHARLKPRCRDSSVGNLAHLFNPEIGHSFDSISAIPVRFIVALDSVSSVRIFNPTIH